MKTTIAFLLLTTSIAFAQNQPKTQPKPPKSVVMADDVYAKPLNINLAQPKPSFYFKKAGNSFGLMAATTVASVLLSGYAAKTNNQKLNIVASGFGVVSFVCLLNASSNLRLGSKELEKQGL